MSRDPTPVRADDPTASSATFDPFEHVGCALARVDSKGVILRTNRTFDRYFGYRSGELEGKTLDLLLPDLPGAADADALPSERVTLTGLRRDGRVGQFDLESRPIDDRSNLVTVLDVTEREELRRGLLESQEINRTATWSFDLELDEVTWSPELFRIFDLPPAGVAPPFETHHQLFTPESWARLEPAVQRAAERGVAYELELQLARRDGDDGPRFAIARCQPQQDRNGKVYRLVGTFQDVTDLLRSRHQHDQLLKRIAMATSAAKIGTWEWNVVTDELVFDQQSRELYGFGDGEPLTMKLWRKRVHPQDRDPTEQVIRESIGGSGRWQSFFRVRHPQRGVRHLRGAGSSMTEPDGTISKLVGVTWDVTDQVQLEDEVRKSQNIESLGVLAGGIAHDFNNLLAGILGRAELLLDPQIGEQRELARGIVDAVQASTRLTAQLMTFAKGGEPVRAAGSIRDLAHKTVDFSLRGSNTRVVYDLPEDLWGAVMDEGRIGQVIQNLAINANQAMASGGCLHVEGRNVSDDLPPQLAAGKYVQLSFNDDGPGVPPEMAERIFDPYFTTKSTGHGLGLAICHSIAERHEGMLRLLPYEENRGATFQLFLPAARVDGQEDSGTIELTVRFGRGRRVLVVDDNDDVRKTLRLVLNVIGFQVEEARSVDEALALTLTRAKEDPFALVITDLTIPGGGGGIELFDRLREQGVEQPIVLMTGYASRAGLADHFDAVLHKPVRLQQISAVLREVLGEVVGETRDR